MRDLSPPNLECSETSETTFLGRKNQSLGERQEPAGDVLSGTPNPMGLTEGRFRGMKDFSSELAAAVPKFG